MEVGTEVIVNERVFGHDPRGQLIGETGIISGIHKFEHADTLYAVILHNRKFILPIYFYKEELSVNKNGSADDDDDIVEDLKSLFDITG